MAKVEIVAVAPETVRERKLDQWYAEQVLKSPDNLDSAARQIITLVTTLIAVLFTVLAVAKDPLPNYFIHPIVHWLGAATVISLLLAVLAALLALKPRHIAVASAKPDDQEEKFKDLVRSKSRALRVAGLLFFVGLVSLGTVLVIAIWEVK